jgi:uncharacterized oxidoreductase
VAEGKVLVAARGGKKLPAGALVDADGNVSDVDTGLSVGSERNVAKALV